MQGQCASRSRVKDEDPNQRARTGNVLPVLTLFAGVSSSWRAKAVAERCARTNRYPVDGTTRCGEEILPVGQDDSRKVQALVLRTALVGQGELASAGEGLDAFRVQGFDIGNHVVDAGHTIGA